ncbi:MAG: ABC transporter substrate-binding protein [Nitrososphaerales archaeon]
MPFSIDMPNQTLAISKVVAAVIIVVVVVVAAIAAYLVLTPTLTPAPENVKLGLLTPLTGAFAKTGKAMQDAAQMAVDEINDAGGVLGRKVVLITRDTAGDPETGLDAALKLILDDKVHVLFGTFSSGVTLAILPKIPQYKVPFLVSVSTATEITTPVLSDYQNYKYVFGTRWNNTQVALLAVSFVTEVVGAKRVFFMSADAKFPRDLYAIVKPLLESRGVTIVGVDYPPRTATDFTTYLQRVKETNPDAVLSTQVGGDGPIFAKQYYESKINAPIYFMGGALGSQDTARQLGDASNYVAFGVAAWKVPITPKTLKFYENFEKRFGYSSTNYEDIRTYDTVYIAVDAIKRANSVEPDKIVEALEKTDYVGACGRYAFDKSHDTIWKPGYLQGAIAQWVNGEGYIVWPSEVKQRAYEWPYK